MLVNKKPVSFKRLPCLSRLVVVLICVTVFLSLNPVLAQDFGLNEAMNIGGGALGTADIPDIIVNIVNIALGFLGIVAVIIIMYGGWIWMTSGGEAEKVDRAKRILRNATIGLLIIFASWALVSFFIREFGGPGTSGPPGGPGTIGGGALGAGIIESVYPPPGARGIPRNTSIFVTFKEPMDPVSIINAGTGTLAMDAGDPSKPNVEIVNNTTGSVILANNVMVNAAPGNRMFSFKPVALLGSLNEDTSYTVRLTDRILKANSNPAFPGAIGGIGFEWSFTVSNLIDITPPYIISWRPLANTTNPRNVIINIKFNEAINPIAVDSNNIQVTSGAGPVNGTLFLAGDYKNVEFLPDAECEGKPLNTCGEPIFCLPANETINTLIIADDLVTIPIDGIQDASGNSLDGNRNGIAMGPGGEVPPGADFDLGNPSLGGGDSAFWEFFTNDTIDLTPPLVLERSPNSSASGVDLFQALMVKFNKHLSMSTLRPDNKYPDGKDYITLIDPGQDIGYWITGTNGNGCSNICLNEGSSAVSGSICGNGGAPEQGEDCDDGNVRAGDGCSSDCLNEGTGNCGDGIVTHAEECDVNAPPWNTGGGCAPVTCQLLGTPPCASIADFNCCGNGNVEPGEACDAGSDPGCSVNCLREGIPGGQCGDGIIQPELGENCDDGNINGGDGCSNVCRKEGAKCGSGGVDIGEDCDPPSATCSNFCLNMGTTPPTCGGDTPPIIHPGEDCDLGPVLNESFIFINHFPFHEVSPYGVSLGSGLRDLYQNCFLPCGESGSLTNCNIVSSPAYPYGWGPVAPWAPVPPSPGPFPSCLLP